MKNKKQRHRRLISAERKKTRQRKDSTRAGPPWNLAYFLGRGRRGK